MLRGIRPLNCAGTYPAVGLGMLIPESIGVALTQGMADKAAAIPPTISTFLWELTARLDAGQRCRLDEICLRGSAFACKDGALGAGNWAVQCAGDRHFKT